ncbi:MAG: hypothetical protein LBB55_04840 [Zoogloeaceae bacterium]|jgi:hypothetical protein|nr:hypothetical protein [Zoogloeaceae bacterium]
MGLLDWLLPGQQSQEDPDIAAGISSIIQIVDPRLNALSETSRILAPAVAAALDFCRAAVADVPGPFDASPGHWRHTPELSVFFASNEEVQEIFSRQENIQDFVTDHFVVDPSEKTEVFALLWARMEEKSGFAIRQDKNGPQHETAIRSLNFTRHHLILPRASAHELEHDLFWGIFQQLGQEILARLQIRQQEDAARHEEIALLRSRLARDDIDHDTRERLQREQETLLQASAPRSLEDTLAWVAQNLLAPETLIAITPCDLRVDHLNRILSPEEEGHLLHLCRFSVSAPTAREGVLLRVRYPIAEIIPRAQLREQIERLFG